MKGQNIDFSHQNCHISAQDKAKNYNESSLKSLEFTFSRSFNCFAFMLSCEIGIFQKE